MRCVFGLLALLVPAAAYATGPCEDAGVTYGTPALYAEAADAFALPARLTWCEERQVGGGLDEDGGTIEFIELRDVRGDVLGRIAAARGDEAQRLEAGAGTFDYVAKAEQAAALAARGFVPVVARGPGKPACTVRTSWTATPGDTDGGWRLGALSIEVRAGTRRLRRRVIGDMAEARRGDAVVVAHFIAKRRKIALFTLRPTCAGPPPGYFGPDDPGTCYHEDDVETALLDARAGALARCFTQP